MGTQKSDALSIFTHLTEAERWFLRDQAARVSGPGCVVVEVGSYLGASTCFLAEGLGPGGGMVWAVDTWTNLAMSEGERDTYEEFMANTERFHDRIEPLRGLSTDVARDFDKAIDLLFVDGDHSYEAVRKDLEAWLPKVKHGGVVVFHDYGWAEGVQQAVREYVHPVQCGGVTRVDSIYCTRIDNRLAREDGPIHASVVIPTFRRPAYLRDALKSILAQETSFPFEVLVLDNGVDADLEKEIARAAEDAPVLLRYVPVPELGLHNGRNRGAIHARGEVVVYVDDDVIAPAGWLSALLAPFDDPDVVGVGGKSVAAFEGDRPAWTDTLPSIYFSVLDLGATSRDMRSEGLKWPETPFGCNMAYRRSAVFELGGFAPDGVGGGWIEWRRGDGESGFARKAYEAGLRIVYSAEGWLEHRIPAGRTTLKAVRKRARKEVVSTLYVSMRKHGYRRFKLFRRAVRDWFRALVPQLKSLRRRLLRRRIERWLPYDLRATSLFAAAFYQMRLALDGKLRRWVSKDDYWPEWDG